RASLPSDLQCQRTQRPKPRTAQSASPSRWRRTPSVEAGYRAPIPTCKHLFQKKMHLMGTFLNIVIFQQHNRKDISNHKSQTPVPIRLLVEKSRKGPEKDPQRLGFYRAKNIAPDQNDSKKPRLQAVDSSIGPKSGSTRLM
ncbi:hypothetical protein, partial [Thalassospira profundimaris]|uniref:hypothetical protein n=2 Tax=Thalassospira profundimaris TaxID=502049 RepID=UPI0039E85607